MSEHIVIARTDFFEVRVPNLPHVPRCDGGHIFIEALSGVENRWELSFQESVELSWLVQLVGEAFYNAMSSQGIELYTLNFQDNGNWAFVDGKRPVFHIHVYGRSVNEVFQEYGQALSFPWRDSGFYDSFEAISAEDILAIAGEMNRLSHQEKYDWKSIDRNLFSLSFPCYTK